MRARAAKRTSPAKPRKSKKLAVVTYSYPFLTNEDAQQAIGFLGDPVTKARGKITSIDTGRVLVSLPAKTNPDGVDGLRIWQYNWASLPQYEDQAA